MKSIDHLSVTRLIAVTGGVCSSLGKGMLASALGVLLKSAGYRVTIIKLDPYLNVDPGTMSPLVHGEVFVTADGAETDLDLGHYERTLGIQLTRSASVSSGQIFKAILDKERTGAFLGGCIQMVPHVIDEICKRIMTVSSESNVDIILIEVGGTVGDIEGGHFLEAIRQLKIALKEKVLHCHLSLVPFLQWTHEYKTKPTQHSVMQLKHAGLIPDMLFLRADDRIPEHHIDKLSLQCGIPREALFQVLTFSPMYELFLDVDRQGLTHAVQRALGFDELRDADLTPWRNFVTRVHSTHSTIKIGLIAKYIGADPYISVIESIAIAGYSLNASVQVITIIAEHLEHPESPEGQYAWQQLEDVAGIIVPGGFGNRGIEGKIAAARFARERNISYLGICLGMHMMLIECARSLLQCPDANSTEIDAETTMPVIHLLEGQHLVAKGGSMRLGTFACSLVKGSRAYDAYQKEQIFERHRHRYEFNNEYRAGLEAKGVVFSGINVKQDLVEIVELVSHPFMLGVQFHPEFQSSPLAPHPLFVAFTRVALELSTMREQTIQKPLQYSSVQKESQI